MESSSTGLKEKKGLGRLWTKVKLALKSKSRSRSKTKSSPTTATAHPIDTPTTHPIAAQRPDPATPGVDRDLTDQTSTPKSLDQQIPIQPSTEMEQSFVPTTQVAGAVGDLPLSNDSSRQIPSRPGHEPILEASSPKDEKDEHNRRYERAQAIFRKYNLDINEVDWESRPAAQSERVYKTPRMRVRWTCHECKTTFGHDKICVECAHQRCRECARYPPKKKKARVVKKAAAAASAVDTATAGPSGVSREEVQEGTCHECQTTFDLGSTECSNCHHSICERCLQETVASAEQAEAHAVSIDR